jgi:hypothetical protein
LGGIALAFNCRDELQAMLQDSLPIGAEALGIFVDSAGRALSSTHADIAVGEVPDFAVALQALGADTVAAPLCQWQGRSYLVGLARSKGYREFKTSDGYRDDVRSVLLTAADASPHKPPAMVLPLPQVASGALAVHYGVVQCGSMLFALAGEDVMEAVATTHMAAAAAASDTAGLLKYTQGGQLVVLPVYDGCKLTGQAPLLDAAHAVAVVVRGPGHTMALLVDRLVDVIACDRLAPPPGGINPKTPWISGFLHDNAVHTEPVFVLDPKGFLLAPGYLPPEAMRVPGTS